MADDVVLVVEGEASVEGQVAPLGAAENAAQMDQALAQRPVKADVIVRALTPEALCGCSSLGFLARGPGTQVSCCGSVTLQEVESALGEIRDRVASNASAAVQVLREWSAKAFQDGLCGGLLDRFNKSREGFRDVLQKWVKKKTMDQVEELLRQLPPLLKHAMKDKYMPGPLQRAQDRAIDAVWHKVSQELTAILVRMLDSRAADEILDREPGMDPFRAFWRYHIRPCDRTVWGCMRSKVWLAVLLACICPVVEVSFAAFLLIFVITDFGDTYQSIIFILRCKQAQFVASGLLCSFIYYFQFFYCVTLDATTHSCKTQGPGMIPVFWSNFCCWCILNMLTWIAFAIVLSGRTVSKGEQYLKEHVMKGDIAVTGSTRLTQQRQSIRITYLFVYDIIAFSMCACVVLVVNSQLSGKDSDWMRRQTLAAMQVAYGILALVFALFALPFVKGTLTHAAATGYDHKGRCRPVLVKEREVEEDSSSGQLLQILQPVTKEDMYELITKVMAILTGTAEEAHSPDAKYSLKLKLVGASGLRGADSSGTSDCFCVCQVPGRSEKIKTAIIKRTCDPHWGYEAVVEDFAPEDILTFAVWDKDPLSDDLLGRASLPFSKLRKGVDEHLPLDKAGQGVQATLHVQVRCTLKPRHGEGGEAAKELEDTSDSALTSSLFNSWQSVCALAGGWNEKMPAVQELLEVWWKQKTYEHVKEIMELIPAILKHILDDPLMPTLIANGKDRVVDRSWPDLRSEILEAIAPLMDEQELEEVPEEPGVDCVRRNFRYHIYPNDKSIWQSIRDPSFVIFNILTVCPGITYVCYIVIFLLIDRGDEYQLIAFIMQFKGTQFISQGIIAVLTGFFTYYNCMTVQSMSDGAQDCATSGPGMNGFFYPTVIGMQLQIVLVWAAFLLLPFAKEKARPRSKGKLQVKHDDLEGSINRSGGYIRYLLFWDAFVYMCCMVVALVRLSERDWNFEDWIVRMSGFTCMFMYACSAVPFFIFSLPVLNTILTHSVVSGYDQLGRCCAISYPPEEDVSEGTEAPPTLQMPDFFTEGEGHQFFREVRTAIFDPSAKKAAPAILSVTIFGAKGLRNADGRGGFSDPYCTCEIGGRPRSKIKTPVVDNNLSPDWFHEAQITEYYSGDVLVFHVWDFDKFQHDDIIGTAKLEGSAFAAQPFEGQLPLMDKDGGSYDEAFLSVRVGILERKPIKVTIVSASGLRKADIIGNSDPYCVCGVAGKSHTRFQTQFVADTVDPLWDHEASIWDYEEQDTLEFDVWDDDVGADDFLGAATLTPEQLKNGSFDGELVLDERGKNPKRAAGTAPVLKVRVSVL